MPWASWCVPAFQVSGTVPGSEAPHAEPCQGHVRPQRQEPQVCAPNQQLMGDAGLEGVWPLPVYTDEETEARRPRPGLQSRGTSAGVRGAWGGLTQVVCHLVRVPQILHSEADDVHKVLHQPEELLGVGAHLGAGRGGVRAPRSRWEQPRQGRQS